MSVVRSGRARDARRSARSHVPDDAAGRRDVSHAQRHAAARRAARASPKASRVETSKGMVMTAFRPRFADFVLKMPRGAQVVYPKDLGPIIVYADIFPGSRVLEAGTGSGALDDRAVPFDRARRSRRLVRAARGASRSSGRERRGVLREAPRSARSARRRCRGRSRHRRSLRPVRAGPAGAVGARSERCTRCWSRAACSARTCPPPPGPGARARAAGQRVPACGDVRDAPSLVARHGAQRATRPSDGRAHGIPHDRSPCRSAPTSVRSADDPRSRNTSFKASSVAPNCRMKG